MAFKSFNKKIEGFNAVLRTISVFAGNLPTNPISNSGEMCNDSTGNLFLCDVDKHCIFKITPAGVISVFAGSGVGGTGSFADGQGTNARFNRPTGITIDSSNNLFVVDDLNYKIRKITSTGLVSTFAGSTAANVSGNTEFRFWAATKLSWTSTIYDGTGTAAKFRRAAGIAIDSSNNLYVCEACSIRKITPSGVVSTHITTTYPYKFGLGCIAIDSSDKIYVSYGTYVDDTSPIYGFTDKAYYINKYNIDGTFIKKIGSSTTELTPQYQEGLNPKFGSIHALKCDNSNNLYISDHTYKRIRKYDTSDISKTVAGNGTNGNAVGASPETLSCLNWAVIGMAFYDNNLYISDNRKIKKIELRETQCGIGNYLSGPSCVSCPAGTFQNSATFTGTSCAQCAAGSYSAAGASSCTTCVKPTGTVSMTSPAGTSSQAGCTASSCAAGYYLNNGTCTPCAAGTSSSAGATSCSPCAAGTYSLAAASSCTSCGTNKYTTGTGSTSSGACLSLPSSATANPSGGYTCATGYYNNGTGCVTLPASATPSSSGTGFNCPAGFRKEDLVCIECGVGTYSEAGASSCTSCGADKYTTGPRSTSQTACLSIPAGATRNSSGTGFVCAAGYSQNQTGCTECGTGTYSAAGASSCTSCGADKYTTGPRSTSSTACLSVPTGATRNSSGSGFSCGAGYSQNETGCAECGTGTYSAAGASSCTSCGADKYTTGPRSTSDAACLSLPPNTISNPSGGYTCASGYYNNGTICVALPPNATVNSSGTGFTCGTGFYNNGTSCVAVPANSIRNSAGTGFTCGAGYSQNQTACTQCGAGTYSAAGASSCSNCGANKYTTGPGSTSQTACLSLPTTATLNASGTDFVCNEGYYRSGAECVALPPNSTRNSSGTGFTCAAGFYNNGTSCVAVPANSTRNSSGTGFTCAAGFTQTATGCVVVPPNATVNAAGTGFICGAGYSQSASGCTQCGTGTYSAAGATSCSSCGSGKFTIGPGSTSQAACLTVPAGSTSNPSGTGFTCPINHRQTSTGCIKCGAGTYSKPGESACTSCCTFATPAAAIAGGCPDSTKLVLTKNSVKCPSGSRANCCNAGFSTNKGCQDQGFWTNSPQFTDNHKRACTSGFANYGDEIDSIAQKRIKEYLSKIRHPE
jgi:hypothetical protein